jgi:glutamate synthase domain-containing protein 2
MSFGALSDRAQISLNRGAKKEISTIIQEKEVFHLIIWKEEILCWQIGTGYFGCRDEEGKFNPELFTKYSTLPNVK